MQLFRNVIRFHSCPVVNGIAGAACGELCIDGLDGGLGSQQKRHRKPGDCDTEATATFGLSRHGAGGTEACRHRPLPRKKSSEHCHICCQRCCSFSVFLFPRRATPANFL